MELQNDDDEVDIGMELDAALAEFNGWAETELGERTEEEAAEGNDLPTLREQARREAEEAKDAAKTDLHLLMLTIGFLAEQTKSNKWTANQPFAGTPSERRETRRMRAEAVTEQLFCAEPTTDIVEARWPQGGLSRYTTWLCAYNPKVLQHILYPMSVLGAVEEEESEHGGLHFGDTPRRPQALCALLYQLVAVFDTAHIAIPSAILQHLYVSLLMLVHKVRDLHCLKDMVAECASRVGEEARQGCEDVQKEIFTADLTWKGRDIMPIFSPCDPEAVLLVTICHVHMDLMRQALGLRAETFHTPLSREDQLRFVEKHVHPLRRYVDCNWPQVRVDAHKDKYSGDPKWVEFERFLRAQLPDDGTNPAAYLQQMLSLNSDDGTMVYPKTLADLTNLELVLEPTRHLAALFGVCERSSLATGSAVLHLHLAACNSTWGNRAMAWITGRFVMHIVATALAMATAASRSFTTAEDYENAFQTLQLFD